MSSISIRRPHQLSQKQVTTIAKKIASDLASEYGISSSWIDSDTVSVQGDGLTGRLHLAPNVLELDIKLGFMLAMFREKIRAGIEARLDKLFAEKPSRKK